MTSTASWRFVSNPLEKEMKRIALAVVATLTLLNSSTAFGQVQCPGVDPEFCWNQYSTCYSDNEGKNCSWQTCQAYCDNEYDECMYGMKGYDWWENPVVSRSVDTSVNDGDDIGCVEGCTAWACLCMYNWVAYRRYDTHWQHIHYRNRTCPNNYSYAEVLQVVDHPSDTCYQQDDSCTVWEEDQECMSQSPCMFTEDGTAITIP
jgi:hypothetical protein